MAKNKRKLPAVPGWIASHLKVHLIASEQFQHLFQVIKRNTKRFKVFYYGRFNGNPYALVFDKTLWVFRVILSPETRLKLKRKGVDLSQLQNVTPRDVIYGNVLNDVLGSEK